MALRITIKWLLVATMFLGLCGCLGGTVAQQLVRSMLMHGADQATAAAIETHEKNDKLAAQKMPLKNTPPDPYQIAFINAAFETVSAQIEPLPATPLDEDIPLQMMQETKLVQVEVWSLLVGDEKQNILEKARLQGATNLPPKAEWKLWQIAIGAAYNNSQGNEKQPITFLIPPEMGKVYSGKKALVELSRQGELNIVRYF